MPITGRTLAGAGLAGLGEGLQQWSAQAIKRKQIQDEWAFELYKQQLARESAQEAAQQTASQKWIEGLMTHPENTAAQLDLAPLVMPNLKPDDLDRLRQFGHTYGAQQFVQRMNTLGKPEDAPADLGIAMTRATGKDYGSVPPTVNAAQWGGEGAEWGGAPELLQAINAQKARIAQLNAAEQEKIAQAGQKAGLEAGSRKRGELEVTHEFAPQVTADEAAAIAGKAPAQAAAAGDVARAQALAAVDPQVIAGHAQQTTANALAGLTPAVQAAKASEAGKITGAQQAAQAPYKTPTMLYDTEGNTTPVHFGPQGATVVPGLPPGLRMEKPSKLTQGQIEMKSVMNVAELNGVQILKALHAAGLDRDNTPWTPRYTNFIAQQLKIAPGDFKQADINQRTAMVQATLLRTMTGARPSREWMDLLAAHLPNPVMSGQQLATVLNNVLQQQGQKRDDMALSLGRSPTWMAPQASRPGEMTYEQWLEAVKQERAGGARAGTAPPGLQTAPAGTSVPNPGKDLLDNIMKNTPR